MAVPGALPCRASLVVEISSTRLKHGDIKGEDTFKTDQMHNLKKPKCLKWRVAGRRGRGGEVGRLLRRSGSSDVSLTYGRQIIMR